MKTQRLESFKGEEVLSFVVSWDSGYSERRERGTWTGKSRVLLAKPWIQMVPLAEKVTEGF
jgi:hypothetical protein